MMLVGFRGLTPREAEPTLRHIREGGIGGVILYDFDPETGGLRNIRSRDQVRELVTALHEAGPIPPLVAIDAEGGFFHRLKEKYGFPAVASAAELGECKDLALTHANSRVIAEMVADLGIDMNMAPVVDLLNPANLNVAGQRRSFSADPECVVAHAREFISAHREAGVFSMLKHFPGLGGVLRPYSPGLGDQIEGWSAPELEPYRVLVAEGMVDAIMVSRATNPALDPDFPACLSRKVVGDLLRGEIGYDGVASTDALELLAIWDAFGFARGTILAVNAGIDLLMCCNESVIVPYSDDRAQEAIDAIVDAVSTGEIAESRIDEACGRILKLKPRRN